MLFRGEIFFKILLLLACVTACSSGQDRPNYNIVPNKSYGEASVLDSRIDISFSALKAKLDEVTKMPKTIKGSERVCKKTILGKICGDARYDLQISRSGAVAIGRVNDSQVRIQLLLKIRGTVGIGGSLAKALGLNKKNVEADVHLTADLGLGFSPEWCLAPSVVLHHQWQRGPTIEIVDGINFSIQGEADKAIRDFKKDLQQELKSLVSCEGIRHEVQKHWRLYEIPIEIFDGEEIYAAIKPVGFGFSPMKVAEDHVYFLTQMVAQTSIGAHPVQLESLPLPSLQKIQSTKGIFVLNVPFKMPYRRLVYLSKKAISNDVYKTQIGGQDINIRVSDFDLFSRKNRLAVEVAFRVAGEGRWSDLSGKVVAFVKPVSNPEGNVITFEDFKFEASLDQNFINVLQLLFNKFIAAKIQESTLLDLSKPLRDVEENLLQQTAAWNKAEGWQFDLQSPVVRLMGIEPEEKSLTVVFQLSAAVGASVTNLDSILK